MAKFNKEQIKEIIPHRDPFLFIDEVLEVEAGSRCLAVKYVSEDEDFFKGHFPVYPVMPGVLILEAMAQVGAIILLEMPRFKGKIGFFTGANNVKWRGQVKPGDKLVIETTLLKLRGIFAFASAKAWVDDTLVCEGDISFAISDIN